MSTADLLHKKLTYAWVAYDSCGRVRDKRYVLYMAATRAVAVILLKWGGGDLLRWLNMTAYVL